MSVKFPMENDQWPNMTNIKETTKKNIYQILHTHVNERKMKPEFGCHLRDYLYKDLNVETQAMIRCDVIESLERWEPRISGIEVMTEITENYLYINVSYKINCLNQRDQLEIPFLKAL